MSTLTYRERRKLEQLFEMSGGYVLDFSNRTFDEFFGEVAGIDIYSERYESNGTSKANRLRRFWEVDSDHRVGTVLVELIAESEDGQGPHDQKLIEECRTIADRLLAGAPDLGSIAEVAVQFDSPYLQSQINRMEAAVESDPALAIGTAKELIETCCKTILEDRGKSLGANPDMSELTRATFKQLKLTRDDVPQATQGAESIRRVLSNLGSISNELNRLRGLYGTGHGQTASTYVLSPRHARLAIGASATLVRFLFESHIEQQVTERDPIEAEEFPFV